MRNPRTSKLAPWLLALAPTGIVIGALNSPLPVRADAANLQPAAVPAPAHEDLLRADIDPSINPGDDFFSYANGTWLKANPIPPSEAYWGIGKLVQDDLYAKLRAISESSAAQLQAPPGSDEQKIGDFWATAMDEAKADQLGLTPLRTELASIDAIRDAGGRDRRRLFTADSGCRRAV